MNLLTMLLAFGMSSSFRKRKLIHRLTSYRYLLNRSTGGEGKFFIWSQSRSGTTLLTQLLNSHDRIDCAKELLARWVPWPEMYVESHRRKSRAEVFGFKLFVHHLVDNQRMKRPGEFLDRLHDDGYRIIYLKRENLLRHSLSQCLRHATGVTHSSSGNVVRKRYRIDIDYLLRHMEAREQFWQRAEEALGAKPYHFLSYERDLQRGSNHQAALDGVFSFLGLEPAPVHTVLKRINDKRLPDLVENYDELSDVLAGTPYVEWLEEGTSVRESV